MAAKRRPGRELTQENWDDEDEKQDAGSFTAASPEAIKGRQIKKAKRRNPMEGSNSGGGTAFKAFTGFGGFGSGTAGAAKPSFSFNPNPPPKDTQTNGSKTNAAETDKTDTPKANSEGDRDGDTSGGGGRAKYLTSLKNLNESVTKWITGHVKKNPFCVLTPIFKDYEEHLTALESLEGADGDEETGAADKKSSEKKGESRDSLSSDKDKTSTSTEAPAQDTTAVTRGKADDSTADNALKPVPSQPFKTATGGSLFSFAATKTAPASDKPQEFSFSSGAPPTGASIFGSGPIGGATGSNSATFSFAPSKAVAGSSKDVGGASGEQEGGEYVPPKDEVKTIEEKDAFYTKRCKLFFKKGDSWQDKGVGNLHLKPCDGKTQLLVRADTNLGNILLNILLTNGIPSNRQGKNNVLIVCVPNPPLADKKVDPEAAVSMLIRVKTMADADELFDKIKDAKNANDQS